MPRVEKIIERNVCEYAERSLGVPNIPMKLMLGTETGWPDRGFLVGQGMLLCIEFKRTAKDKPTPKQVYIHNFLRKLGYVVQVHHNEDEAIQAIRAGKMEAARLSETVGEVFAGKLGGTGAS